MNTYIAYYRVSTDKQGKSGLGLDAQRKAVADYLNGGAYTLAAEFTEVESGKRNDRPELEAAIVACRKHKATLVIAKLDRLSRNVAFIAGLMERNIKFVACDMPSANSFMLHIYASVAQEERRLISERTRKALAAARERGVKLGGPKLPAINQTRQRAAIGRAKAVAEHLKATASMSLREAASELNRRKVPTANGAAWGAMTVKRARGRL